MSTNNIYKNLLNQLERLFRHNRIGSFKTRERYYKAMKRFCRFLAEQYRLEKLANIAPKHIYAYVEHMQSKNLAASTIKTDLAAIRFWHDMMTTPRFKLPANDELGLERRCFGKVDRSWSTAEVNKMLALCLKESRHDYCTLVCLGRYAGLRIHECFRIDSAIAENAVKSMEITIKGKGGKVRTVPINESVHIELKKMLEVTERGHKLFVPNGVPTHIAINRFQQFIMEKRQNVQDPGSDRPMTFHGLRHTYAQEQYKKLISSGYTEEAARLKVSQLLGHERPDVTQIYLAGLKDGEDDV